MPPVILAHGALGIFDEVIFIGVVLIFGGMMAYAWWRSRNAPAEVEGEDSPEQPPVENPESAQNPDHFRLE